MIQHIFKTLYNQRKENYWIMIELFVVFILFWYICDYFLTLQLNSFAKNGFDIENTYRLEVGLVPENSPTYKIAENEQEAGENFITLIERIRNHPAIEFVSYSSMSSPYNTSDRTGFPFSYQDNTIGGNLLEVSPDFFQVFRIAPAEGGTPELLSKALSDKELIVSSDFASMLFPEGNGLNKTIYTPDETAFRIGGISIPIKKHDYSRYLPYFFAVLPMNRLTEMNEQSLSSLEICIRTKQGIPAEDFSERFMKEMKEQLTVGNFSIVNILPFDTIKERLYIVNGITDNIRYRLAFIYFLLISIFLGIIGTFWFRNEQRKSEIALRIAIGSSKQDIIKMMLMESWSLLVIISLPAIVVCVNIALMGVIDTELVDNTIPRFLLGILCTYIILGVIIFLGAVYPAYLSSQTAPAETLKSE